MKEREYKCNYRHCSYPQNKVRSSECVMIGKKRYHKECAEIHEQIERIKRIYFDYIDGTSDYVQVVGVINNLIFKKGYGVEYVEFVMKYIVAYACKIKSPYTLHLVIKNPIVEKKWSDARLKMEVIQRFDCRTRAY